MAFTYFLIWTRFDMKYFGVRYAKKCHPADLMTTYFTSSKHVHRFIEKNGLPDKIEIDRTFEDVSEAREWETKQLIELGAAKSPNFLNKTDNKSIDPKKAGHGKGKTYEEIMGTEKAAKLRKRRSEKIRQCISEPGFLERRAVSISKALKGTREGANNNTAKSVTLLYQDERYRFETWKEAAEFLKVDRSNFCAFTSAFERKLKRGSRCPVLSQVQILSTRD